MDTPDTAWKSIDDALQDVVKRRSALDADELVLLIEAKRLAVHLRYGFTRFVDYLEKVLGHAPRAAQERLHVAEAADRLPRMSDALGQGRLVFSAMRELVRVAVPETESAWLEASIGRTVRVVEAMVAGKKPGDLPGSSRPANLEARLRRVGIKPTTYDLLVRAKRALELETGTSLNDDEVVAILCRSVLEREHAPRTTDRDQPPAKRVSTSTPPAGVSHRMAAALDAAVGAVVTEVKRGRQRPDAARGRDATRRTAPVEAPPHTHVGKPGRRGVPARRKRRGRSRSARGRSPPADK